MITLPSVVGSPLSASNPAAITHTLGLKLLTIFHKIVSQT